MDDILLGVVKINKGPGVVDVFWIVENVVEEDQIQFLYIREKKSY